jgi:hypothetical protein
VYVNKKNPKHKLRIFLLLDLRFAFVGKAVVSWSADANICAIIPANVIVTVTAYYAVIPILAFDIVITTRANDQLV